MKKMGIYGLWASLAVLTSCSNLESQINGDFSRSIEVNASSVSHIDWESNEVHPKYLFKKYREEYLSLKSESEQVQFKKTICDSLTNQTRVGLLVFEEEINNLDNREMIKGCYRDLDIMLQEQHAVMNKNLKYSVDALSEKLSNIDFKVKVKVIEGADLTQMNKYTANLNPGEVFLTFDDGPDNRMTESILRTLDQAGAKATFYALGRQVNKYPQVAQKVHKLGHVVGSHSMFHLCLGNKTGQNCEKNNKAATGNKKGVLTATQAIDDIENSFSIIKKTIGTMAPFFRFPYGANNDVVTKYLKERGVYEAHWNVDTNDWRKVKENDKTQTYTNADLIKSVGAQLDKHKGGVVLFHDVHRRSAEVLPQFLYEVYKRGYTLVIFKNNPIQTRK